MSEHLSKACQQKHLGEIARQLLLTEPYDDVSNDIATHDILDFDNWRPFALPLPVLPSLASLASLEPLASLPAADIRRLINTASCRVVPS